MFRIALLSAVFPKTLCEPIIPYGVSTTSKIGTMILSSARRLDDANENDASTWISGYSLKFEACRSTLTGNNYGYGDDDGNGVAVSRIVEFRLCPTGDCSNCAESGLYAISLEEFLQAYMYTKRETQEDECAHVKENCYDDDESNCYANAGLDYCEEEMDIDKYLACAEAGDGNGYYNGNDNDNGNGYYNGNYNGNKRGYYYYNWYNRYQCFNEDCNLFVGAKCSSDGSAVILGAFIDETCSIEAPDGAYEAMNSGFALTYSSESIIDSGCQSCLKEDDNNNKKNNDSGYYYYYYYDNYYQYNKNVNGNNGDNNQNYAVSEMCGTLYESAIKCEENITDAQYPDSSDCYYIKTILPRLDAIAKEHSYYASLMYWSVIPLLVIGSAGVFAYSRTKSRRPFGNLAEKEIGGGASVIN